MRKIYTAVDITATPQEVWSKLLDLGSYGHWNPAIVEARGTVEEGSDIMVVLTTPGGGRSRVKVHLVAVKPLRELRWRGALGHKWLLRGERSFTIHTREAGVRFEQSETFNGLISYFLPRSMMAAIEESYRSMNEELKRLLEGPSGGGSTICPRKSGS